MLYCNGLLVFNIFSLPKSKVEIAPMGLRSRNIVASNRNNLQGMQCYWEKSLSLCNKYKVNISWFFTRFARKINYRKSQNNLTRTLWPSSSSISSLAHVIKGTGSPTALHESCNCSPTDTVLFSGTTITSGDAVCTKIYI